MRARPFIELSVLAVASVAWMVAVATLAVLVSGCSYYGADDTESGPDAGDEADQLADGTYRVDWTGGTPGTWLDCDGLELRDGAWTLSWLGGSCREPALVAAVVERCAVYEGAGYAWWLCTADDPGTATGERHEGDAVVATFSAERLR